MLCFFRCRRAALGAALGAALLPWLVWPLAACAAEGMWTLDNLPRTQMQARHGFVPDAAWLDKAMRASARLAGGCSASFVSADGLVMSNHHCVTRCIADLSGPGQDLMAQGFLARDRRAELRCPNTEVNRLESITDVTDAMQAATAGKQGAAYQAAEDAARAQLTSACRGNDADTTRCDLVTLYRGGQHQLYKYRRYADVRLVWAPEAAAAAFGGDPDNFNFPRWALDAAFLRVYEDGRPAVVPVHFSFRPEGAEAGELVFVTGHPGSTQRQLTVAQLEAERDTLALHNMPRLSEQRGLMLQLARGDAESRRLAMGALQGIENGLKVTRGRLQALGTGPLLENKRRAEQALRNFVASQPELAARTGDPWSEIAAAQRAKRELQTEYLLLENGEAFLSAHFAYARLLVRGAAERARPNAERLREFNDTSLPQIEQRLRAAVPLYPAFEQLRLAWSLNRLRSLLGADDPVVRQVLGPRSPEEAAAALLAGTQLGDAAERQRLWAGGAAAVAASDDSFIRLVQALEPAARALRARYEAQVLAVERRAGARIAAAQFAQSGRNVYPDATFSLRLSYGEVAGWEEKGRPVPPFTDLAGAFRRHTGVAPFALPEPWLAAQPRLNLAQRYNFSTTHDVIGGNSGSPMLDRQGRIVGLVFDGNVHSLAGAFAYDERDNRTVAVHAGAIVEALRQVYGADALVQELLGGELRPRAR